MSPYRDRRQTRWAAPRAGARARARARRTEGQLDELLWQVAAEPDSATDAVGPAELRPERIARDVERWRQTLPTARAVRLRPRGAGPRAAAAALALCIVGATSYWQGLGATPTAQVDAAAGPEKSWYVQVAQAPDTRLEPRDARACSSESWYCVQVSPDSRRREL